MPNARVLKGGWTWKGESMVVGQIIDAPSAEWIANRVADGGLVEALPDEDARPLIESATVAPEETAAIGVTPVPSHGLLGTRRRGSQRRK